MNVAFLISALFVSFHASTVQSAPKQDYCAFGDRIVLILVDRTTAYDRRDRKIFSAGFERIVDTLQLGDKVLVQTIANDYAESETIFQRCLPGCPETGISGWLLSQCRSLQARADLTSFKRTLAGGIRQMLNKVQSHKYSDITRTLARATTTLQEIPIGDQKKRQLALVILFSDLLENSVLLPWPKIVTEKPKQSLSVLKRHDILPDLDGSEVIAFGFGRHHNPRRSPLKPWMERRLRRFWTLFLRAGGAKTVSIRSRLN